MKENCTVPDWDKVYSTGFYFNHGDEFSRRFQTPVLAEDVLLSSENEVNPSPYDLTIYSLMA